MKRILQVAALFLLSCIPAFSQGNGSYHDVAWRFVQGFPNFPAPGAVITVCQYPATSPSIPCLNLATIYGGPSNTPVMSNPLTADQNGNFSFWASPGNYILTVTGNNVIPYEYTITVPGSSGFSSFVPVTVPSSVTPSFNSNMDTAFTFTLNQNVTSSSFVTNPGGNTTPVFQFNICENSTGGFTMAWPSNVTLPPGYFLNTNANACSPVAFVYNPGSQTWSGFQGTSVQATLPNSTLPFSATPSFNGTVNAAYTMVLTGNVTNSSISGIPINGNLMAFHLCQDGVGSRTFSWPPNFITPPTLQTAANSCTDTVFKFDATNWSQLIQPSGGGGGGGSPAGPNGAIQIQNAGNFGGGPLIGTVSIKPQVSDNRCYVSQNGNDANDGLSIGSAKLTVYSCLTTVLPGGTSTTAGNGTVLIGGSVNYGGPVANQGMWLMGGNDPNFASPPAGWLKVNGLGPLTITLDCFAQYVATANGHTGHCGFSAGNAVANEPAVWISSVAGSITLNNVAFPNYIGNYIRYGIDSNNNRNGSGGSSGLALNNISANNGSCTNPGQTGPSIDFGSNSFWIWLKGNTIPGCQGKIFTVANSGAVRSSNVTTITTTATNDISNGELVTLTNITDDSFNGTFVVTVVDGTHFTYSNAGPNTTSGTGQVITARAAAISINPGIGSGSGLIFIDDTNLNGGNIRYAGGANGGGMYVHNVSYEGVGFGSGVPDPPTVLITSTSATSDADGTNIHVDNVEVSDANNAVNAVQVDNASTFPDLVIVSRIAGTVRGKMTVLGGTSIGITQATNLRQQQYGLRQGQLTATGIDVARRGFSPVVVPSTNLAITSPSSWTFTTGSGTIASVLAPDKTSNAGRVTFSSGIPSAEVGFYTATTTLNLGDTYVFGIWTRSATNNGYNSSVPPIKFVFTNNGFGNGDACAGPPGTVGGPGVVLGNIAGSQQSDGQWQYYSGVCKVIANPATAGILFGGSADASHTTEYYAPVVMLFPAGTISDNEAYEIAHNLSSFPSGIAAGTVSMLRGQSFAMGTGAQFLYSMSGTPTADRVETWPDIGGIVGILSGSLTNGNCPKINIVGGVTSLTDTGSPCGGNPAAPNLSVQFNNSGPFGGIPVPTSPNGVPQVLASTPTGGVGTTAAFKLAGVAPRASTCPSNTDTILATDRTGLVTWTDASTCNVTLPQAGTGGGTNNDFTSNFVFVGCDSGAGSAVVTPTTSTISFWNGGNYTSGASTLSLSKGQCAFIYSDNTNYFANVSSSNGVTSITDGTGLFTASGATGAVTLAFSNEAANKVLANCTNGTAPPAFCSIVNAMLPGAGATTVNGQTCALGSTCTIPPGTIIVPNASSTGTTVNTLTKLTGATSTAVITATTDTGGAIGITTSGAGTTGSATIQLLGSVSCVFDGATIAGDYVQISSAIAGNCHDTNSGSYPLPGTGMVVGRVLSTNGVAGTYTIDLFSSEINVRTNALALGSGGGTAGQLACVTASNTMGNCTGTPPITFIGVFLSGGTTYANSGIVSVVLDATQNVTFGDILCASTIAGKTHDNGAVACANGQWVGQVTTTASSVSTVTANLRLQ